VAWCRHAPDDGKYRVGLEFVEPAVDLELALKSVTDDVLGTAFDKTPAGVLKAQLSHQGPARVESLEEELSPLAGKIQKSWMDQDRALHVEVLLDSGQLETVKIPATRLLRDYRDKQGNEVAALGCSQSSSGKRWRFLNYEQQAVLDVECNL
jgi:hypothetical protein